jgi:hypothetical protein
MIDWKPIGTFDYGYRAVLLWLPTAHRGTPSAEVAWWCGDKEDGCWWTNGSSNAGDDMDEWSEATHWAEINPPEDDPNGR